MNDDWFIDWFNTKYYHTLYQNRDENEACNFIDKLCNYLKIKPNAQILDLACGKGRHSVHLAKKGYHTTGVDLAPKSIMYAKQHAIENSNFEVHDMRYTYRKNHFNYVFNLFTSFGYFDKHEDNLMVFNAAVNNLTDGGCFVLDFLNVDRIISNLVPKETKIIDGIQFDLSRKHNNNQIVKDIIVSDKGENHHFQERVFAYNLTSLKEMAALNKLKVIQVYGDYNLNEFHPQNSNRLILIMQKQVD